MRESRRSRTTIHRLAAAVITCGATADVLVQSRADAPTTFDVASVRRYQPATGRPQSNSISVMPGGRFTAPSATLRGLISAAYAILDIQIADPRRVLGEERFEIEARTRADAGIEDARVMLRALLADRFGLKTHTETQQLAVYTMTLARQDGRLGEQLHRSGPECAPVKGPAGVPPPPPPPPGENVGRALQLNSLLSFRCGSLVFSSTSGGHWSIREITMSQFAGRLVAALGRPVIDRTGLDGAFDLDLSYTPDNPVVDASNAPNAPSLLTALREQLGLSLESGRAPVEILVVDSVQPPTEN